MSKRLKKNAKTLQFLTEADNKVAKAVIKASKADIICCFSEICYNLLKGTIDLSPKLKTRLSQHKQTIRKLAKKSVKQSKKKHLVQKGGFLGAILPLVKTLLPSLLGGLLQS